MRNSTCCTGCLGLEEARISYLQQEHLGALQATPLYTMTSKKGGNGEVVYDWLSRIGREYG